MNNDLVQSTGISTRQAAIIAGISLLLMAILAPITNFIVIQGLIDPENAAKTFSKLSANSGQFRLGILLFMIVAILDVVVAWALYIFLRPVNRHLSLLAAWFRIIYATMLLVALTSLVHALQLLSGPTHLEAFTRGQLESLVMLSISAFNQSWNFSLIIFGLHLLVLAYLFFKAGYLKKILGILLFISAFGYAFDGIIKILLPERELTVSTFTFVGELVLIFWLLISGTKRRVEG